jgi:hypothetical protein
MQPTLIGIVVVLAGFLIAVMGSTPAMMTMLMLCGLMAGSAAIILTALGGSSIPPIQVALGFLVIRILLPTPGNLSRLRDAIRDNAVLIAYVFYGLVGSYALPRIFARAMNVPPLRFTGLRYIYDVLPLAPTSQNVTTAVYLLGTLLVAISMHVAVSLPRGPIYFVRTAVVLAWAHLFFGVAGIVLKGTPADAILQFFRNGSYAQLDQSYGGFVRINGIAPEASSYADYAFCWFVLIFECWLRGIKPRWTGITAVAMLALLLFSTSGTAYVALTGYGVVLLIRLLVPDNVMSRRMVTILGAIIGLMTLVAVACIALPSLTTAFSDMVLHMTVDKGSSQSGLQRAFWAKKGIEAFFVSYGLGIGPGSFRSSSLGTAILGSTGIIGAITFAIYVLQVLRPWRNSTFVQPGDALTALGAAASWAALVSLFSSMIAAPSCDPGTSFAIFSGVALALRRRHAAPMPHRPSLSSAAREQSA